MWSTPENAMINPRETIGNGNAKHWVQQKRHQANSRHALDSHEGVCEVAQRGLTCDRVLGFRACAGMQPKCQLENAHHHSGLCASILEHTWENFVLKEFAAMCAPCVCLQTTKHVHEACSSTRPKSRAEQTSTLAWFFIQTDFGSCFSIHQSFCP